MFLAVSTDIDSYCVFDALIHGKVAGDIALGGTLPTGLTYEECEVAHCELSSFRAESAVEVEDNL